MESWIVELAFNGNLLTEIDRMTYLKVKQT